LGNGVSGTPFRYGGETTTCLNPTIFFRLLDKWNFAHFRDMLYFVTEQNPRRTRKNCCVKHRASDCSFCTTRRAASIHLAGIRSRKHTFIEGVLEFLTYFAHFLADLGEISYRMSPYKAVKELRVL
jgi:hypothetical protein